ncbi:MAG: urease accessory protein UreE [Thermoleophilia bacterium]
MDAEPVHVTSILGDLADAHFAGRVVDRVSVASADAAKRRLRLASAGGVDLAVDLPRGSYLRDGAVLHDDGARVVAVERRAEEAVVVRLAPDLAPGELLRQAVALGHAFGNQHVPVEVEGDELRVPVTTSAAIVGETLERLHLHGATWEVRAVPLGRERPLSAPAHHH